MGEAEFVAKFDFAPLNAHVDTNHMGWVACDVEVLAGECSCNTSISYVLVGQKRRSGFQCVRCHS